jgi:NAD(P)-dependent dehydrogenase (short-subunit alcohol dehydrogenase family)
LNPKPVPPADLRSRLAVVTGASGNIGRAVALALAAERTRLVLAGRDQAKLDEVARLAQKDAGEVLTFAGDLTVDDQIERLVDLCRQSAGSPDVLVHCMGIYSARDLERTTLDDLDRLYRVNLRAPVATTKSFLPLLAARQGHIVFINSGADLAPRAGTGVYSATKQALKAIADSLREEVGPMGIRVTSVYLGRTASPLLENTQRLEGIPYELRRLPQPEDVARTVTLALKMPPNAELTDLRIRAAPERIYSGRREED